MKVLIIDNYDSFTYNLVQIIEQSGLCELEVVSYHEANDELIKQFDKIVMSPGPGIPSDFPNLEIIVKKFYKSKSFLGVCLGHEAIALAFGGTILHLGRVFHGVTKRTSLTKQRSYIFDGVPQEFDAGLYHSWALDEKTFPNELVVTARAEDGVIMAYCHKEYDLTGFQFHPESIMTKDGKTMIRNWLNFSS
ncbi:MAG: aminodeoxychorismate/anthranilate synthase component II [Bacteroidales bacterium]|nr:aminodeoxychorismate/anthranilate synthase component II [Bacteroidales bacterium]